MSRFSTAAFWALLVAGCSSGDGDGDGGPAASPPSGGVPPPSGPAPEPPAADPPFAASALFVLGDSLSDVGNAAGTADHLLNAVMDPPTVGLCNPADVLVLPRPCDDLFYQQSRVSDGPVAVEHLAAHLKLGELEPSLHLIPGRPRSGTGYAVAGAKARGQTDADLGRQLDWLLLDHAPLPADAVYVLMIGGNDAIDALQADSAEASANPRPSAAIVTAAVTAIGRAVERLRDFGARRLVVANVPDLATLPAVRAAARASGAELATLAAAAAISEAFDRELDAVLDGIEANGQWLTPAPLVIERADVRAALAGARQATAAEGGNTDDACFDSDLYRSSADAARVFHPDCAPMTPDSTPRFAEFVFWDGIHPTGRAHAAIGASLSAHF